MKRYEILKIDISTPEAAIKNLTAFCSCPPKTPCIVDCAKCRAEYLLEDIPTKKSPERNSVSGFHESI